MYMPARNNFFCWHTNIYLPLAIKKNKNKVEFRKLGEAWEALKHSSSTCSGCEQLVRHNESNKAGGFDIFQGKLHTGQFWLLIGVGFIVFRPVIYKFFLLGSFCFLFIVGDPSCCVCRCGWRG